jgi:hypothetical protein
MTASVRRFLISVLVLGGLGETEAQQQRSPKHGVLVEGYGVGMTKTCAAFLRETDDRDAGQALEYEGKTWHSERRLYFEWLAGFFTARSLAGQPVAGDQNMDDMVTWLHNYCQAHPLDDVLTGVMRLSTELSKK